MSKRGARGPTADDGISPRLKSLVAKRTLERDGERLLVGSRRLIAARHGHSAERVARAQNARRVREDGTPVAAPLIPSTGPRTELQRAFEFFEPEHLRRHLELLEEPMRRFTLTREARRRCERAKRLLAGLEEFAPAPASRSGDYSAVQAAEIEADRRWSAAEVAIAGAEAADPDTAARPELQAAMAADDALRAAQDKAARSAAWDLVRDELAREAAPLRRADVEAAAVDQAAHGRGGSGPLTRAARLRRFAADVCTPLRDGDPDRFWTDDRLASLVLQSGDDWTEPPCPRFVAALGDGDLAADLRRARSDADRVRRRREGARQRR